MAVVIGHESGAAFWLVLLSGAALGELARLAFRAIMRAADRVERDLEVPAGQCELCGDVGPLWRYGPDKVGFACFRCSGAPDYPPDGEAGVPWPEPWMAG